MVRNGNLVVAVLDAQLLEPLVAQTACSHLHRLARALHLAYGVETLVVDLHAVALGHTCHQLLVFVALLATQAEVAVCHTDVVATLMKERHQHHRIDATTDGQQYVVVLVEHIVRGDISFEIIEKLILLRHNSLNVL